MPTGAGVSSVAEDQRRRESLPGSLTMGIEVILSDETAETEVLLDDDI
jgi:hypothetical protein